MLRKFWEEKKHLIQLTGILTGVGALFLSINPPENANAREALANIQFVWLIIITISFVILFLNFIRLVDRWEKETQAKYKIDITDTFSILLSLTLVYLLLNLWTYLINLYKESLYNFIINTEIAWFSILTALYFYFWRKNVLKIPEKPSWKRISFSLSMHAIFSAIVGIIYLVLFFKSGLSLFNAIVISTAFFLLFVFLGIYSDFKRKNK